MEEQLPFEDPDPDRQGDADGHDNADRKGDAGRRGGPGPDDGSGEPGAVSAVKLVKQLARLQADDLRYSQAAQGLVLIRELLAWAEGRRARLIDQVCATAEEGILSANGTGGHHRPEQSLAHASAVAEVACALNVSESLAHRLSADSEQLVHTFPSTLLRMEAGRLSHQHAAVIVDEALSIPEPARPGFEKQLLAVADGLTRAELAGRARRARERAHPESITRRRAKAACDRRVQYQPQRDGMAWLGAYLPAEAAVSGYNRVTAAARSLQGPAEDRTLTQLRADVFTDLLVNVGVSTGREHLLTAGRAEPLTGVCAAAAAGQLCAAPDCPACKWPQPDDMDDPPPPEAAAEPYATGPYYEGIKAEVLVTVPVFSMMGLTDEPAELEGYGPIPADVARRLAAGADSFKRILTHPETGAMLSFGRTTYKVPADLKRAVRVRDPYCGFAGCHCSAQHCEMDHVVDWYPSGETSYSNIKPGCKKHHRLKHHGGWKSTSGPAGQLHWQSPAGLNYTTKPEGPVLGLPNGPQQTSGGFPPWLLPPSKQNEDNEQSPPNNGTPPPF